MSSTERNGYDRRAFLRVALGAPLAIPAAGALLGALGCGGQESATQTGGAPAAAAPTAPAAAAPKAPAVAAPKAPAAPAAGGAPMGDAGGEKKLVTEVPASAALVQQLQYVNQSTKPDQNCANCMFYTAENEIGKCQLFPQGYVKSAGWCLSWAKKI